MPPLGPQTSPQTYALIGALLEVHKRLGPGYLGSTYGDALELKAQQSLTPIDEAQVLHYLKTMGLAVALLVNFGAKSLEVRRFVGEANWDPKFVVGFV